MNVLYCFVGFCLVLEYVDLFILVKEVFFLLVDFFFVNILLLIFIDIIRILNNLILLKSKYFYWDIVVYICERMFKNFGLEYFIIGILYILK